MQIFLNSIIYLLAIMGIILTTMTFFEMFFQRKILNSMHRIFSKDNNKDKKIEIIIYLENITKNEEEELIKKIIENNEINLKEIATSISIQKIK